MKNIKIGSHTVTYYDSIEDLPVSRFQKFNKLLMIDAGVGSSVQDFDVHLQRMAKYVGKGQIDNYNKEVDNIRQNLFFITENLSPKHRAFAALIRSVDGKNFEDISDSGLDEVFALIHDVTVKELDSITEEVKKKLNFECKQYFPSIFDDSLTKEYYSKLREWTLLTLEKISAENSENITILEKKINTLADEILLYSSPRVFSGPNNAEVEFDKAFDTTCMFIAQNLHVNPSGFTVLQFYNALTYVKETLKRERTSLRRR